MYELFRIANEEYYIDLDKISEFIKIEPGLDEILTTPPPKEEVIRALREEEKMDEGEDSNLNNNEVIIDEMRYIGNQRMMMDVAKWEVVRALLESLLNENGVIDESMGMKKLEQQLSIPFRLSFNTLLINKIIKRNG